MIKATKIVFLNEISMQNLRQKEHRRINKSVSPPCIFTQPANIEHCFCHSRACCSLSFPCRRVVRLQ
jgi:hypothetical protein